MKKIQIKVISKQILADTITPVSIYLKIRDVYPSSVLLEGADYQAGKNSFSFICLQPLGSFKVENGIITETFPETNPNITQITDSKTLPERLNNYINQFEISKKEGETTVNGLFGYAAYDCIKYFEDIKIKDVINKEAKIPDMIYSFYKYIIAINHFKNTLTLIENQINGEKSQLDKIESLLQNRNFATYRFKPDQEEKSNISDEKYMEMVKKGIEHCYRGDVFQIVLSRQFSQQYKGDDFNVYRALRSINPSPYLFYFDYGNFRLFGSSPETQLEIHNRIASINPIAGTFKRTGYDEQDKELATKLMNDPKENAEHVMLVDLARNDLSRCAKNVKVDFYKEIHYYSHVLHMVSKVSGNLPEGTNSIEVMANSFPAGTLSGAPKYKAMELIDKYENINRGYYGGCLGYLGFNGDFNQAIMIRSFMSKNNTLYYQAGAGIVSESKEESELNEVNNKLAALKSAIVMAGDL